MPKFPTAPAGSVTVKPFGKTPDGQRVHLYTLVNATGMEASVASYGATVTRLITLSRNGKPADVILGCASLEGYRGQTAYLGAIIGRYGNRIARGRFTLEGERVKLAVNNGANTLHGGVQGFDKHLWTVEVLKQDPPTIRLSRLSPDGEEGYPGNLKVAVTYTLTARNELRIDYAAQTDKTTVLNLTNHMYFNLAGAGSRDILDHQIRIHASRYVPVNKSLIPIGTLKEVAGTPFDFREWKPIGAEIKRTGGDPYGYDHTYVLDHYPTKRPALAVEVREPKSGRVMTVSTDQPGVQFYTGNFLDGSFRGKGGKAYQRHHGFCLETQHFPNSPNEPRFPSTVLKPGGIFRSTTIYRFSAK